MNAFVRQLAVLSVVWSFCELLLPDGKQQKMVRMTVSVLVMAALISAVSGLLQHGTAVMSELPAPALALDTINEESYAASALRAIANQAENLCVRIANRAGYCAAVAVYLRTDGSLDHIELCLTGLIREDVPPLISQEETAKRIAEMLEADPSLIWLKATTTGEMNP